MLFFQVFLFVFFFFFLLPRCSVQWTGTWFLRPQIIREKKKKKKKQTKRRNQRRKTVGSYYAKKISGCRPATGAVRSSETHTMPCDVHNELGRVSGLTSTGTATSCNGRD